MLREPEPDFDDQQCDDVLAVIDRTGPIKGLPRRSIPRLPRRHASKPYFFLIT